MNSPTAIGDTACAASFAFRPSSPPLHGNVLVLQNPGRVSRFYLLGLARGLEQLGYGVRVIELGDIWSRPDIPRERIAQDLLRIIERERIAAVIGYTFNGIFDLPLIRAGDADRSIFGITGVPHVLLWTDHPQWAHERTALHPNLQAVLRQPNHVHIVKADYAADEISDLLGWPNVHGLAMGEDTELIRPAPGVKSEFDVVMIVGSPPYLPEELSGFVEQNAPDEAAMYGLVAQRASRMLEDVWRRSADGPLRDILRQFGRDWIEAKRRLPHRAAYRHFCDLAANGHADAATWLRAHPMVYFDALHAMWEFGRWQRTFLALYLGHRMRVGVFGADWSGVGLEGGGGWVDYDRQAEVYARGLVALNVNQCNDEEGVSHKVFQITASGAPCLHLDRVGLSELFVPEREIEVFATMREARDRAEELVADSRRRERIAQGGLERTRRDHTWVRRIERILSRLPGPREAERASV